MTKRRKLIAIISFFPALVLMCVIFILSNQPAVQSSELSGSIIAKILELIGINVSQLLIRKAAHACEFCLLAFLFSNSFTLSGIKKWHIFSFVSTVLYACTDEIHQIFIPGRACRVSDILIDTAGALIGISVYYLIIKIIQTVRRKKDVRNSSV